jgi:hypothetical protein
VALFQIFFSQAVLADLDLEETMGFTLFLLFAYHFIVAILILVLHFIPRFNLNYFNFQISYLQFLHFIIISLQSKLPSAFYFNLQNYLGVTLVEILS